MTLTSSKDTSALYKNESYFCIPAIKVEIKISLTIA